MWLILRSCYHAGQHRSTGVGVANHSTKHNWNKHAGVNRACRASSALSQCKKFDKTGGRPLRGAKGFGVVGLDYD